MKLRDGRQVCVSLAVLEAPRKLAGGTVLKVILFVILLLLLLVILIPPFYPAQRSTAGSGSRAGSSKKDDPAPAGAVENPGGRLPPPLPGRKSVWGVIRWLAPPANFRCASGAFCRMIAVVYPPASSVDCSPSNSLLGSSLVTKRP